MYIINNIIKLILYVLFYNINTYKNHTNKLVYMKPYIIFLYNFSINMNAIAIMEITP
jgi:hypothetical protein